MSRDALTVGISAYHYLPSLNAPAHDAEAIAQQLQITGDFRVTRLPEIVQSGQSRIGFKTQVSLAELEAALVRLFKPRGSSVPHTALFYFSGHGLQKDAGIQEGYLATSDTNPQAGIYGLSLFWLRRLLQESPVRQRIVLLDCCHSGELLNFLEADPGARSGTDRLFMAASREYESAYESIAGHYSVFTQALLDGLNPERVPNGVITNYALTDWVSTALKAEMQQPLFENSGSEIILTRGPAGATVVRAELMQDVCPYRGLEFFDEVHAEYFFGREDLTDHLLEKLRKQSFIAIAGASGSGKSSLVRAGLIHQLRQGRKLSGSDRWCIKLITPTDQPLRSLASAFVSSKALAIERAEQLKRAERLLKDGGVGLSQLVRASLMSEQPSGNERLVLVIDQFEEIFTLCQGPQAERDRHQFFNCLLNALQEVGHCLTIIVVMRADFFGKCSLYNGLAERIQQTLVTVTPLTYEQIKASIVKPIEKVRLVCESSLVYNILLDIVGSPGELPLLQYTLLELWRRRQPDPSGGAARLTLDAYTELGGVRGTLQKRADEIFYSLTAEEQQVAKRIFMALTQLGDGTEDTRRRILKSELVSPQFPIRLVERVLEKLVAAKLIVTNRMALPTRTETPLDQSIANWSTALRVLQMRHNKSPEPHVSAAQLIAQVHGRVMTTQPRSLAQAQSAPTELQPSISTPVQQETIDVAHETLIRHWTLLKTWLDENREMLRRQRRIEQVAREWESVNQPISAEYLLRGDRLSDAADYLKSYPGELSALAQRYISVSAEESRRAQKEMRLLQIAIPCTLLAALVVTFNQYQAVVKSQAEKEYQAQVATSRQRAAIAQSVLQDPDGDPTLALLISRLAIEQGGRTYEAQASLRAAVQNLRLQANLQGHEGTVRQIAFSPNQQLATAGTDGTVRLWSLQTQQLQQILRWEDGEVNAEERQAVPHSISAIAFSADGQQIAAIGATRNSEGIAKDSSLAYVWSAESGRVQFRLQASQAITMLALSARGDWIATAASDNTLQVWSAKTGQLHNQRSFKLPIRSLEFSPNGQTLLIASGSTAHLWQLGTGRLAHRATPKESQSILSHPVQVNQATFSPDGQLIATAGNDGKTRLWQVDSGRLRHTFGQTVSTRRSDKRSQGQSPIDRVLFSPDGQLLAARDLHNQVRLWSTHTGQLRLELRADELQPNELQNWKRPIAFSPDSQQLLTTNRQEEKGKLSDRVQQWTAQTGQMIDEFREDGGIEAIGVSPNGALIATVGTNGFVHLWSAESGGEFPTLQTIGAPMQWVAFRSPASGHKANAPQSPNTAQKTMQPLAASATWQDQAAATQSRALADTDELISIGLNGKLERWKLPQRQVPSSSSPAVLPALTTAEILRPPQSLGAKALSFLRYVGGRVLFWKSFSLEQGMLDAPAVELPASDQPHYRSNPVSLEAGFTQRSTPLILINATAPSSTPASTPSAPVELARTMTPGSVFTEIAFSPDTQLMATADSFGKVTIWEIQPDESIRQLQQVELPAESNNGHSSTVSAARIVRQLAFSPAKQTLLGVGDDNTVYEWEISSGSIVRSFKGHEAAVASVQSSPDGSLIVTASRDRTARIWQHDSGKLLTVLNHREGINSAYFSPDGQLVVTASEDGTARVMNAITGQLRVVLTGHRAAVLHAEFSPDGRSIVTAGADGMARLWDAHTGAEHAILRPSNAAEAAEPLQRAFFSPDGRFVATQDKRGQIRLWAATWETLLELARDRSLRQLKPEECLRYLGLPPNACPVLQRGD